MSVERSDCRRRGPTQALSLIRAGTAKSADQLAYFDVGLFGGGRGRGDQLEVTTPFELAKVFGA